MSNFATRGNCIQQITFVLPHFGQQLPSYILGVTNDPLPGPLPRGFPSPFYFSAHLSSAWPWLSVFSLLSGSVLLPGAGLLPPKYNSLH